MVRRGEDIGDQDWGGDEGGEGGLEATGRETDEGQQGITDWLGLSLRGAEEWQKKEKKKKTTQPRKSSEVG
jgi:hypothetical protein